MSVRPPGVARAPSRARRVDPRGRRAPRGVSWVTLLLLLALAAGAYLAWVWVPVYVVHYEVKQVARDYMNQAIKQKNDSVLVTRMVERMARLDTVVTFDERGEPEELPAVDVDPRDVTWERDLTADPPMLRVSFVYEREVPYPWLDRIVTKEFAVELENELTVPVWGSER